MKQISHILSENDRLVRRTQLKRSHYSTVGKEAAAVNVDHEEDQGDDAEFYDEEVGQTKNGNFHYSQAIFSKMD